MAGGVAGLLISLLVIILLVFLILRVSENGTIPARQGMNAGTMVA